MSYHAELNKEPSDYVLGMAKRYAEEGPASLKDIDHEVTCALLVRKAYLWLSATENKAEKLEDYNRCRLILNNVGYKSPLADNLPFSYIRIERSLLPSRIKSVDNRSIQKWIDYKILIITLNEQLELDPNNDEVLAALTSAERSLNLLLKTCL